MTFLSFLLTPKSLKVSCSRISSFLPLLLFFFRLPRQESSSADVQQRSAAVTAESSRAGLTQRAKSYIGGRSACQSGRLFFFLIISSLLGGPPETPATFSSLRLRNPGARLSLGCIQAAIISSALQSTPLISPKRGLLRNETLGLGTAAEGQ